MDASFILTFLTVGAAISSYFIGREDSKQKDRIEKVITKIDSLTQENQKLISIVNDLSKENNTIASRVDTVVNNTKELAEQNIQITEKASNLLVNVEKVEEQSKNILEKLDTKTDDEFAVTGVLLFKLSRPLNFSDEVQFKVGSNTISTLAGDLVKGEYLGNIFNRIINISSGFDKLHFRVDQNNIIISATVYDLDKHLLVELDENKWRVNKNFISKFNYDETGFEMFDNYGNVVLSLDLIGKNKIEVQAIMPDFESGAIGVGTSEGSRVLRLNTPNLKGEIEKFLKEKKFRKIFEYTGDRWRRKRVPTS